MYCLLHGHRKLSNNYLEDRFFLMITISEIEGCLIYYFKNTFCFSYVYLCVSVYRHVHISVKCPETGFAGACEPFDLGIGH